MSPTLLIGIHGSEDPTRAALACLFAKGAVETGYWPQVILAENAAGLGTAEVIEVAPRT